MGCSNRQAARQRADELAALAERELEHRQLRRQVQVVARSDVRLSDLRLWGATDPRLTRAQVRAQTRLRRRAEYEAERARNAQRLAEREESRPGQVAALRSSDLTTWAQRFYPAEQAARARCRTQRRAQLLEWLRSPEGVPSYALRAYRDELAQLGA